MFLFLRYQIIFSYLMTQYVKDLFHEDTLNYKNYSNRCKHISTKHCNF